MNGRRLFIRFGGLAASCLTSGFKWPECLRQCKAVVSDWDPHHSKRFQTSKLEVQTEKWSQKCFRTNWWVLKWELICTSTHLDNSFVAIQRLFEFAFSMKPFCETHNVNHKLPKLKTIHCRLYLSHGVNHKHCKGYNPIKRSHEKRIRNYRDERETSLKKAVCPPMQLAKLELSTRTARTCRQCFFWRTAVNSLHRPRFEAQPCSYRRLLVGLVNLQTNLFAASDWGSARGILSNRESLNLQYWEGRLSQC